MSQVVQLNEINKFQQKSKQGEPVTGSQRPQMVNPAAGEMLSKENIQKLWDVMAELFANWTVKHGASDEMGVWRSGLRGITEAQLRYGMAKAAEADREFPPSCGTFKSWCLELIEQELGLPGRELLFPHMMNLVSTFLGNSEQRDLSGLNPAMYWIYRNLDISRWKQMNLKESRAHFNGIYQQCVDKARTGFEFIDAPKLVETEDQQREREYKAKRNDPVYMSKRKQAGISALAEMRRGLA